MRTAVAGAMLAVAVLGATFGEASAMAGDEARVSRHVYKFEWKAPFADMSPQGAAIIADAMRQERIPANAEEVRRARQRVLDLISAEPLDVHAIRKAQAQERAIAIKEHARAQEKMLKAYQRLSPSDRRAFAEGMRVQEERMMKHLARARERMKNDREQMRREMEKMQREVERVKKETGGLWIIVPEAPMIPVEPDDRG